MQKSYGTIVRPIRLTVKLKPSGGASHQESSGSKISERGIPGFVGHFTGPSSCSGSASGSNVSTFFICSSLSASSACGNMISPASETVHKGGHEQTPKILS
ncbi:hypothetical protein E1A91_D08G243300v1 [Gossypium mustelinum]|uniref:Uncharacterized protein n=1 Tax=Gossypium mustelinum TaxID=34275 RepID=A0A5D2TZG8_GOSMU|nr:hypothetical protein E1A91_D08G243300v1 [Gossypium mustelinum]